MNLRVGKFTTLFLTLWAPSLLGASNHNEVSIVALPFDFAREFQPACVSTTESGELLAFQSGHAGGHGKSDIWFTRRQGDGWSAPVNAGTAINSAASEYDGKLSADGTTMVFIRSDQGVKPSIFITYFRNGQWTQAQPIGSHISSPETSEYGALLSRDGRRLYFSSDRAGGLGGFDVYYSVRQAEGSWGNPVNLGAGVNSAADEVDAALSPDEKFMVIGYKREDSLGDMDLYLNRNENGQWNGWHNLGPRINTAAKDACPWLGYDGRSLYLNSTWEGLLGGKVDTSSRWGGVYMIRLPPF